MVLIRQCSLAAFFVLVSANSFANDDISDIYCGKLLNVENGRVLEDILINIDNSMSDDEIIEILRVRK